MCNITLNSELCVLECTLREASKRYGLHPSSFAFNLRADRRKKKKLKKQIRVRNKRISLKYQRVADFSSSKSWIKSVFMTVLKCYRNGRCWLGRWHYFLKINAKHFLGGEFWAIRYFSADGMQKFASDHTDY